MILIAENMNVMSQSIGAALKERLLEPIQSLARAETVASVDYLDLNIGPARKTGAELMPWLVKTVQEVSHLPLSLDTTNPIAIEEGLKICNRRALINSVSLQPERLDHTLPLALKYNADMIGLLWGEDGMPRDCSERCMHTVNLIYKAGELGIPPSAIWIDPIVTPISNEINQVKACVEFMSMLAEIAPECKSIVGLSNVSNGTPTALRSMLNRTYLIMLMRYGLYAAIVDAFDTELAIIARGGEPDLVQLVYQVMDNEDIDLASLSKRELDYVKSTQVLAGHTLYSHSWLEI